MDNKPEFMPIQGLFSSNVQVRNRLTNWKNEPSVQDLLYDIHQAKPAHSAQVSKISKWVDLLYAETDKKRIKK